MEHASGFLALVNATREHVSELSGEEARALLNSSENAVLVDVREDHEWEAQHAAAAVHLGKGVFERDVEAHFPDPSTELILYCGGGYRSLLVADVAARMGYTRVHSLEGGYKAMLEAGWPMESSTDPA